MIVHVVYTEYQNSDPSIIGVFASEAGANAAKAAEIKNQQEELHNRVYNVVPFGEDPEEFDEADWDVDVHLETFEVEP